MDDRLTDMRRALLSAVNADGGWGYYPGHASRLEPTCWALLALRTPVDAPAAQRRRTDRRGRTNAAGSLLCCWWMEFRHGDCPGPGAEPVRPDDRSRLDGAAEPASRPCRRPQRRGVEAIVFVGAVRDGAVPD